MAKIEHLKGALLRNEAEGTPPPPFFFFFFFFFLKKKKLNSTSRCARTRSESWQLCAELGKQFRVENMIEVISQ